MTIKTKKNDNSISINKTIEIIEVYDHKKKGKQKINGICMRKKDQMSCISTWKRNRETRGDSNLFLKLRRIRFSIDKRRRKR